MVSFHLQRFRILPMDTEKKCRVRNISFCLSLKLVSYLSITCTYHILFLKSTHPYVKIPMLLPLQALKGQAILKTYNTTTLYSWFQKTLNDMTDITIVSLSELNECNLSRDSPCMIAQVPGSTGIGRGKV